MSPFRSICVLIGFYRSLLVLMCPYGSLDVLMRPYVSLCVLIGPYASLSVLMGPCRFNCSLWILMGLFERRKKLFLSALINTR